MNRDAKRASKDEPGRHGDDYYGAPGDSSDIGKRTVSAGQGSRSFASAAAASAQAAVLGARDGRRDSSFRPAATTARNPYRRVRRPWTRWPRLPHRRSSATVNCSRSALGCVWSRTAADEETFHDVFDRFFRLLPVLGK